MSFTVPALEYRATSGRERLYRIGPRNMARYRCRRVYGRYSECAKHLETENKQYREQQAADEPAICVFHASMISWVSYNVNRFAILFSQAPVLLSP